MAAESSKTDLISDWIMDRVFRFLIFGLLKLSFDRRRNWSAWLVTHIVSPLAGFPKRIRTNLKLIYPDMPKAEVERLVRAVPGSLGRTLIEAYSGGEFIQHIATAQISGPGAAALEQAHRQNRPVMLATGHIGNYDAVRAALGLKGYRVGGLYRPMSNPFFNRHYVDAISKFGTPLFPRNRKGLTGMLRFLKAGGMVGVVLDQHMSDGEPLDFMGKTAMTSLSIAQMARRYNALVVPVYGLRRDDGGFDLIAETPIKEGDDTAVTQALNDSLAKQVGAHPEQWLWTHRRWRNLT